MRAAFVAPRIVSKVEDRKPPVTIFLLRYLEREVSDGKLKVEVAEAIKYIEEQTAKE